VYGFDLLTFSGHPSNLLPLLLRIFIILIFLLTFFVVILLWAKQKRNKIGKGPQKQQTKEAEKKA